MKRRSFFTGIAAALVAVAVELQMPQAFGQIRKRVLRNGLAVTEVTEDPMQDLVHIKKRLGASVVGEHTVTQGAFEQQGGLNRVEHAQWEGQWGLCESPAAGYYNPSRVVATDPAEDYAYHWGQRKV